MVSVNSLTAFWFFLFKNVYFILQKYYNHQSGLPFFGFFSRISVHESMFLKNASFLQKILGIADYGGGGGGEEESCFFSLTHGCQFENQKNDITSLP